MKSSIIGFLQESPISASDIEDIRESSLFHICDDSIELWPRMMLTAFRECLGEVVVGHRLFKDRCPSLEVPPAQSNHEKEDEIGEEEVAPEDHILLVLESWECKECQDLPKWTHHVDKDALSPWGKPSLFEGREECDQVDNSGQDNRIQSILCYHPIEDQKCRESKAKIVEPIDWYIFQSLKPVYTAESEWSDHEDRRDHRHVFTILHEDKEVESDKNEPHDIGEKMWDSPSLQYIPPERDGPDEVNTSTRDREEEFISHNIFQEI